MGNQLGIGFRFELVSALHQVRAQVHIVLDDSVMDYRDRASLMRMSVGFRWPPVRGPARVAYPDMPIQRRFLDQLAQIVELAARPPDLEGGAAVKRRDSRRVVTAIFQPPQSAEQNRRGLARPDVSHDSAHRFY